MISIHTNAASLTSMQSLSRTQTQASTSMQRLGTGYRINSAMDDAAGLQIATRLDAQANGMTVAMRNTQNGVSLLQTSEGALSEVTNILNRMKDLSTQAADASSSSNDRSAMQSEYDALGEELNNIMKNTSFGGQKLLMGTGVGTGTAASANINIDALSTALDNVSTLRSQIGAAANRLDHVHNNLSNMVNNVSQAKGRIMDTDYATQTAHLTTQQMLSQASASMLKQSGSLGGLAMGLLG